MKKIIVVLFVLTVIFANCNKLNHRDRETTVRYLVGNWHLINSYQPKTNKLSLPESDTFDIITFNKDSTYKSKTHVFRLEGNWELNDNNTRFKLIPEKSNTPFNNREETFDWIILKLDDDTLRYQMDRKGIHDKLIKTYAKTIKK